MLIGTLIASSLPVGIAHAQPLDLGDDQAVIVGSDGVVYTLNLSSAVATANGQAVVPSSSYSALEADPTLDVLYLTSAIDASLRRIDLATETATLIEDDYGWQTGASLEGLARRETGTVVMSYAEPMTMTYRLSEVNLTTGVLTQTVSTSLGGTNTGITAMTDVAGVLYGFTRTTTDQLFTIDPATGVMTSARAATGSVTGIVVAADTLSTGEIFFLTFDNATATSTLYRTIPSQPTVTRVGIISGLGAGVKAENFAISTLLESERPDPEPEPEPEPSREKDSDEDELAPVEATPTPPAPVRSAPTVEQEVVEDNTSVVDEEPAPLDEPPSPADTPPANTEPATNEQAFPLGLTVWIALGAISFFIGFFLLMRRVERRQRRSSTPQANTGSSVTA